MNLIKFVFATLLVLINVVITPSAWADAGKFIQTPEYAEVTQAIDNLLNSPEQSGLSAEKIQQKLGGLRLEKYIMETAEERSQCRNETGKTLAVYTKSKKAPANQPSTLSYLGAGQETDDDYACEGIYLPSGGKFALAPTDILDLTDAIALKIVPGTQLVAKTNPAGAIDLNISPAKILKAGEGSLAIPNLTQADIDAQVPNAPID